MLSLYDFNVSENVNIFLGYMLYCSTFEPLRISSGCDTVLEFGSQDIFHIIIFFYCKRDCFDNDIRSTSSHHF